MRKNLWGTPPSVSPWASQTRRHIAADDEDDAVFSIVAVQVKWQMSNKIVQTYAFLDPGSSGTFCTANLAKRLGRRGKLANILLRTMGQKKIVSTAVLSGLEVSGILSVVSSLYDPLGFLAPFTMPAKLTLQELCRRNLKWDEQISPSFSKQWSDWLSDWRWITALNFRTLEHLWSFF